MKQIILMLAVVLTISSCKKADEPQTLLGEWSIDSYTENGLDKTTVHKALYTNYVLKFDASNNYIETYQYAGVNTTNAGPWKLTNGGEDFELTNQVDNTKRYFHIVELNPSSATVTEDSGAKSYNLRKI
jgi:hypothetical protein